MTARNPAPLAPDAADREEQAAQAFVRRRFGPWTESDQMELEGRFRQDAAYADAFQRVEQSWAAIADHATSAEIMGLREQALARARRANVHRWLRSGGGAAHRWRLAAAVGGLIVTLGIAFQLSPYGLRPGEYVTGIGEQRVLELEDHSRIALDAATRLRVRFSDDARIVELLNGQAQFSVAVDPARPFKVEAGEHTVIAVGTAFTVEYIDREMRVAMLEGRVAVLSAAQPSVPLSLVAGEALRVQRDGAATFIPKADLDAATAWRKGKVIFHSEPLGEAVRRLNRYSRLQLQIENPELAAMRISGVFEAGDTQAFAEAIQSYLPVTASQSHSDVVILDLK